MPSVRHAAALVLTVALCSSWAIAKPCGSRDLLETYPPTGARRVPTDATLTAHYAANAVYGGERVTLEHRGVSDTIESIFNTAEGLLDAKPPEPLVPGDRYVVTWPDLRGIDTNTSSKGREVTFDVGDGPDERDPTFDGLTDVGWDVQRERDDCTDSLEDRFVFDLTPGAADDDGGRESLALKVFQVEGRKRAQVLTSPLPQKGQSLQVGLAIEAATGKACFGALVRDLTGKVSNADKQVCVTTTAPPFFYGCRLSPPEASRTASGGAPLALFALSLLGWRRHRAHS